MKVAPTYFADTAFWIALLEANDKFHSRAIAWQRRIVAEHNFLITTDAVLWEMLNYFAAPSARIRAIQLYRACQDREEIGVEPFGQERCEAALSLYEQRPDKAWGITDCLGSANLSGGEASRPVSRP